MSSLAVRQAFETAWPTLLPGIPLQDTINEEPDRAVLPDQWATVDYIPSDDPQISLGEPACWRESGVILVVVFALPGLGDDAAVTMADAVRDGFRYWKDPTNEIKIDQATAPESGGASDGRWFAASVSLSYQYDRVI